jgi:hypothetical protein
MSTYKKENLAILHVYEFTISYNNDKGNMHGAPSDIGYFIRGSTNMDCHDPSL